MSNQIVSFEGGLNTKLHPQYVKPNQAVVLNNADVFDGTLSSSRGHEDTLEVVSPYFYNFKGVYLSKTIPTSFVEYNQKLFWSNEAETRYTEDGIHDKSIGTNPPDPDSILDVSILMWDFATNPVSIIEGTTLQGAEFEYRMVHDGYTYNADVVADKYATVELTFTTTAAGTHQLYRRIDVEGANNFRLVGEIDGAGIIIDGGITLPESGTWTKYGKTNVIAHIRNPGAMVSSVIHDGTKYYAMNSTDQEVRCFRVDANDKLVSFASPPMHPPHVNLAYWRAHASHTTMQSIGDELYLLTIIYEKSKDGHRVRAYNHKFVGSTWVTTQEVNVTPKPSILKNYWSVHNTVEPSHTTKIDDTNVRIFFPSQGRYLKYNGILDPVAYTCRKMEGVTSVYMRGTDVYYIKKNGDVYITQIDDPDTEVHFTKFSTETFNDIASGNARVDYTYPWNANLGTQIIDDWIIVAGINRLHFINSVTSQVAELDVNFDLFYTPLRGEFYTNGRGITGGTLFGGSGVTSEGMSFGILSHVFGAEQTPDPFFRAITEEIYAYAIPIVIADTGIGSAMTSDTLTGTYSYKFTNSEVGGTNESAPSEKSADIVCDKENVVINFDDVAAGVQTHFRVYRFGITGSVDYHLVGEVSSTTPIADLWDNLTDTYIFGQPVIPESGAIQAFEHMRFLTYHRGRLWGVADDLDDLGDRVPGSLSRLYFSALGDPLSWEDLGYLQMPKTITAIGSTPNGLVVASLDSVYAIMGTTLTEFSVITISERDGCVSYQSMQSYKGLLLFMGRHGLQQTNGGTVTNISRDIVDGLDLISPKFSAIVDDTYYVDSPYGILTFDFRTQNYFSSFSSVGIEGMENIGGKLQLCISGKLHNGFVGAPVSMDYRSTQLTSTAPSNLKEYHHVWIKYIGEIELDIILSKLTITKELSSEEIIIKRITIPKKQNQSYSIEFNVRGIGTVLGIEFSSNLRLD